MEAEEDVDDVEREIIGSEELVRDLMKMLKSGSKNDVTIVCQDGELKANRDILVARSEYFATMLSNENFVEAQSERIEMKNVYKESMEVVLEYLFTGTIRKIVFKQKKKPKLLRNSLRAMS